MVNYQTQYLKDLNNGNASESLMLVPLQKYFKDITLKLTTRYSKFDYLSDNLLIELKTLNSLSSKFKYFMISQSKLKYARKFIKTKRIYFIFKYIDKCMFYEFEDIHPSFIKSYTRTDRNQKEPSEIYEFYHKDNLKTLHF